LPDATVIPLHPGEPERLSPSKAARRAGNTGPQPRQRRAKLAREEKAEQLPPAPAPPGSSDGAGGAALAAWLEEALALIQRRLRGDYAVDEFGFDPELNDKVLMALVRPLYQSWFRVEATGLEHVPAQGGALVVANHSGTIPFDAVMTQVALLDDHPAHRHLRMLGANLVFATPFISELARASGHTLACHPDAELLLDRGELVGVWPEGFKGIGKPFSERYKLQRFGRGGFVAAAVKAKVPIIPTAIVGAEEIYPMIGESKVLARLLGLPYFPITPTFPWLGPAGMVPLPSKWYIHFGEPISTHDLPEQAAEDPMIVFNLTDQVREQIQQEIYRLLMKRPSVFG
jgi:1-acyl-sn-glycerol-3-phosphate acyltransferase